MKNKRAKVGQLVPVFFFLGVILLGFNSLKAEVDKSIVLSLHFDEGGGEVTKDSSANGNDGKIHGATWAKEGKAGSALSFDGADNYVDVGKALSLTGMDKLTVETWVKRSDKNSDAQHIVNAWITSYISFIHYNNFRFAISTEESSQSEVVTSSTTIDDGLWHHLVGTYDGSWVRIYVDGEEEGTPAKASGKIQVRGAPIAIGAGYDWGPGMYFKGIIDEVKIYNRALSEEEIESIYLKSGGKPKEKIIMQEGKGIINDFEDLSDWQLSEPAGKADWPSGVTFTLSTEEFKEGQHSGKISWKIPKTEKLPTLLLWDKKKIKIPEEADGVGFWVYGTMAPCRLGFNLVDKTGERFVYGRPAGLWKGWKFLKFNMEEDYGWWDKDGIIDYPISFSHFSLYPQDRGSLSVALTSFEGTIYFDNLVAIKSGRKEDFTKAPVYKEPSPHSLFSNPPRGDLWFAFMGPYSWGYGDLDWDKKVLDSIKTNGLLDCPVLTPILWVRVCTGRDRMEGIYGEDIRKFDGDWEGYFGEDIEELDSYFRKLCRLLKEKNIYFYLSGGNPSNTYVREDESEYNEYVKRRSEVASAEAPDHFVGIWIGEPENYSRVWRYDKSLLGREKRANLTVKTHRRILESHHLGPKTSHIGGWGRPVNPGYWHEAGYYIVSNESLFLRDNQEFLISQSRGVARSFGDGHIWGTDVERWCQVEHLPDGTSAPIKTYEHPVAPGLIDFSDAEVYKSFLHSYYSGSQWMDIGEFCMGGEYRKTGESYLYDIAPGFDLTFTGEVVKKFFDYIKDHPRIGKDYTETALVRSHLDNMYPGCNQEIQAAYQSYMDTFIGDPDRDWIFLNIWFPHISHDKLFARSFRYWTGTPYGPIDIIYDRVPDLEKALSNYKRVFLMGYQDITDEMYKTLASYVYKGGILFVEAPHLLNLKPSLQKELFGCEVKSSLNPVGDKITFVESSVFNYPKGEDYLKGDEKDKCNIYQLVVSGGEVLAKDTVDNPILVGKKYGQGYVLVLANYLYNLKNYGSSTVYPTLNSFTYTVLDKIANYPSLSLDISPKNDYIEFFARKDKNQIQVFLMNHGKEKWEGEVLLNKRALDIGEKVEIGEATNSGYKNLDSKQFLNSKDTLKIKASLGSNGEREAKFSLIKVVYQGEER